MTIALAVGITISSRSISTARRTTNIDTSSRALAAAEASIEYYLARPVSEMNGLAPANCNVNPATLRYPAIATSSLSSDDVMTYSEVNITRYGCLSGGQNAKYDIRKDGVLELKLNSSSGSLDICWESPPGGPEATLYYHYIYEPNANDFRIKKEGYNPVGSGRQSENNMQYANPGNCFTRALPGTDNPRLLRIMSLYAPSTITMTAGAGTTLQYQGFTIKAAGVVAAATQPIKRNVTATRSLPYLPALFNFAVYSNSSNNPID
ncbi:hypothetical protein HY419_00310 [candidate division WWE3 bacterium]|nr:hypothetical protein [candidate division WWE3 bacterium]